MADNDVLVITSGAGGMGLACAWALADRGHLLLVDVDQEQLEEARSLLSAQGARVETLQCDVTSPADVAAIADRVHASGRFRCLVHTVGVSPEMADARTVTPVELIHAQTYRHVLLIRTRC
jgi:NAD(P)-dependent dehydrogenase (short-subunit alcohol dehydrogenase family)